MGIQRVKLLFWLASLGVGGLLAWTVVGFVLKKQELMQVSSLETQQELLDSVQAPPMPKEEVVDYAAVTRGFIKMNWTGKEVAKAAETGPHVPKVPKKPVAELLKVLAIQVDLARVEGSLAYVAFVDKGLESAAKKQEDRILRVGEALLAPYASISVESIGVEGVRFRFQPNDGEEPREAEVVAPVAFEGTYGVVLVGDGGVIQPTGPRGQIGHLEAPLWKPNRTQQVSANLFQLGTEDVAEFNESYAEILTKDIDYKQYRNPKTGQVDGIEITKVAKGSLPASHGVQEGEVLKSINGHKVTTVNEAIAYVKKNADTTSEWVAVFERNGREVVRTYKSPPRD